MELHGAADLERDLRRASLASDSRPNLDQKRQTGELRAQLQELSELYEGEMQRRSEAETTKIEMEQAMERLKEDHAAELRACQDHANTHVAMYRKKCKDLKTNVGHRRVDIFYKFFHQSYLFFGSSSSRFRPLWSTRGKPWRSA